MAQTNLWDVRKKAVSSFSGGMRQRFGIAQAMLGDPDLLIVDEPTAGLDPEERNRFHNLLSNIGENKVVILSTHILPEVALTCQKVLIINRAKIVASGTPEEMISGLVQSHQTELTVRGSAAAIAETMNKVANVSKVETLHESPVSGPNEFLVEYEEGKDPRAELSKALVDGGHGLIEMRTRGLSLEDVFIRIVSGEEQKNAA